MPVLSPSGTQFYIKDLENEVLLKTENRVSDTARADVWIRDSLLEFATNPDYRDDFPELELLGPQVTLTPLQQEYSETLFVNAGDVNCVSTDILIWVDFPNNTIRRKLDTSHYQKTDRFQPVNSLPTEWYRFGQNIGFNPVPNLSYQVQMRMVRMHPINDNVLNQTLILLPRDWNEAIILGAVQRGFVELMEYEKANAVHQQLYGDPDNKNQPGILFHLKRKRRKEAWRMESRLSMTRRPYCWGHP